MRPIYKKFENLGSFNPQNSNEKPVPNFNPNVKGVRHLINVFEQTNLNKSRSKSVGSLTTKTAFEISDQDNTITQLEVINTNGMRLRSEISLRPRIDTTQQISYQSQIIALLTQIGAIESNGNLLIKRDKQQCLQVVQDCNQILNDKLNPRQEEQKPEVVPQIAEVVSKVEVEGVSKVQKLRSLFERKCEEGNGGEKKVFVASNVKKIELGEGFKYVPYSTYVNQLRGKEREEETETETTTEDEKREVFKSFKYNPQSATFEEKHSQQISNENNQIPMKNASSTQEPPPSPPSETINNDETPSNHENSDASSTSSTLHEDNELPKTPEVPPHSIPSYEFDRTWSSDESNSENDDAPSRGFYSFTADVSDDSEDEEFPHQKIFNGYRNATILEEAGEDSDGVIVDEARQRAEFYVNGNEEELNNSRNSVLSDGYLSATDCGREHPEVDGKKDAYIESNL